MYSFSTNSLLGTVIKINRLQTSPINHIRRTRQVDGEIKDLYISHWGSEKKKSSNNKLGGGGEAKLM